MEAMMASRFQGRGYHWFIDECVRVEADFMAAKRSFLESDLPERRLAAADVLESGPATLRRIRADVSHERAAFLAWIDQQTDRSALRFFGAWKAEYRANALSTAATYDEITANIDVTVAEWTQWLSSSGLAPR